MRGARMNVPVVPGGSTSDSSANVPLCSPAFILAAAVTGTERRVDGTIVLPPDPSLVGATASLQAFGLDGATPLRLGQAVTLTVFL
jgi:hypothetical protein